MKPLWRMVSEAHFFAQWRECEEGIDWATLGGRFTVERFMGVLLEVHPSCRGRNPMLQS